MDRLTGITIDMSICGLAVSQIPLRQGAYLGLTGRTFFWGAGDAHEEFIITPTGSPEQIGMMRSVRAVGGKVYAVGMQRQVYRRDDANQWVDLSQAIRPPLGSGLITSFEAVDGFDAGEIYVCGRDGEVWWYDGSAWRQVASPTNAILTNIVCAADGNCYICSKAQVCC